MKETKRIGMGAGSLSIIIVPERAANLNRTRKDAAAGVDGMTAAEYEVNLDERLRDLLIGNV